jgi:dipeptidyl aminopeptidase/acylaminoacyl peptidase
MLTRRLALVAALAAIAVVFALAPLAEAAFPGSNGRIAFVSYPNMYDVLPDGSGTRSLGPGEGPSYSPDGTKIAFGVFADCVYVTDADGAGRNCFPGTHYAYSPAWSPDETKIAVSTFSPSCCAIVAVNVDGTGATQLTPIDALDYSNPSWSPDGAWIAASMSRHFGSDERDIVLIAADGSGVTNLTCCGIHNDDQPNWSPDGTHIVFSQQLNGGDDQPGIVTIEADGNARTPLAEGCTYFSPVWAPDGTKIAYSDPGYCGTPPGIFTMNPDGTQQARLTNTPSSVIQLDWQPIPLSPPPFTDSDHDGVADAIDTGLGQFGDDSLVPPTTGSIVDAAGLVVRVEDADSSAEGVKITVGPGSGPALLSVCGASQLQVAADSSVVVTCGSVTVHVEQGSVKIILGGGITIVSIPADVTAKVTDLGGGKFSLQNLSGNGVISVTVDGVQTTVGPHATTTVATFDFQGFSQPVDNATTLNVVKAGQAVPFKWRLLDAGSHPLATLGNATMTAVSLSCSVGTTLDQLEEVAPGATHLQNLGNGYYQLNWQTPKSYAGSCKTLKLDLGEGVTRDALFKFTK